MSKQQSNQKPTEDELRDIMRPEEKPEEAPKVEDKPATKTAESQVAETPKEVKKEDDNAIHSVEWLTPRELVAMPFADCRVTREKRVNRLTKAVTETYFADIFFDKYRTVSHHINLSSQQYALIATYLDKGYIGDQFECKVHVRIIKTKWSDTNSSYILDAFFNEDVRMSFNLVKTDFLALYLLRLQKGLIDAKYSPLERIPTKQEAIQVAPSEAAPKDNLPF